MSNKLPVISSKELVRFLEHHGFKQDRQKGSHIILTKEGIPRPIVIPKTKELSTNVVMTNLKTAKISRKALVQSMRNGK